MKFFVLFSTIILVLSTSLFAQEAQYPILKGYGGIYEIPNAVLPSADSEYKIVIDLKTLQKEKGSLNLGLNNVARMMNLHGLSGVKAESLKVAIAIHGGATDIIINNAAYKKRYGVDNPNIDLIATLKDAGVEVYVCGQSLIARKYDFNEVNTDVTFALSMLTVFTTYMQDGYLPLVFD